MLFTDRDLGVFDSDESRQYFSEILQLYYGKNYRAAVVQLYSFVIYDLYCKLQTMANEGDKKAKTHLDSINKKIEDNEHYSSVERSIVSFYSDECPLYFNSFDEDVEYLKNCRDKCAHLKVNDNSLYTPQDYHVAMMICSMYDNIFSVKAPFIMDLFSFAQPDVEYYSSVVKHISREGPESNVLESIKTKYLNRMTYDSLKKSYCTFLKLLFCTDNEDCENNIKGLFVFLYAMTDYAIKKGYERLINEPEVMKRINNIQTDLILKVSDRWRALSVLMIKFPTVMDSVRNNAEVFEKVSTLFLEKPARLRYYRNFHPRSNTTVYEYFLAHEELKDNMEINTLHETVNADEKFKLADFLVEMANSIPSFNGYYDADSFMRFFTEHLSELEIDEIDRVYDICISKQQCRTRDNFKKEMEIIKEHKKKRTSEDSDSSEDPE